MEVENFSWEIGRLAKKLSRLDTVIANIKS